MSKSDKLDLINMLGNEIVSNVEENYFKLSDLLLLCGDANLSIVIESI